MIQDIINAFDELQRLTRERERYLEQMKALKHQEEVLQKQLSDQNHNIVCLADSISAVERKIEQTAKLLNK